MTLEKNSHDFSTIAEREEMLAPPRQKTKNIL